MRVTRAMRYAPFNSGVLASTDYDVHTCLVLTGACGSRYIFLSNFLGMPSISVPVGVDKSNCNMPVGMQFLGSHWTEHDLLRLARACEHALPRPIPNYPLDYVDMLDEKL